VPPGSPPRVLLLDSFASAAIHLKEPGCERLIEALGSAAVVGAPTLLEAAMPLSTRLGRDCRSLLLAFVRQVEAEVMRFTSNIWTRLLQPSCGLGAGVNPAV
jgi:uncharacterized protein with PIN domain